MVIEFLKWADFFFQIIASRTDCPVTVQAALWFVSILMVNLTLNLALRMVRFLSVPALAVGALGIAAFYLKLLP